MSKPRPEQSNNPDLDPEQKDPFILEGKYYKITSRVGNSVSAHCQHCLSELKGSTLATSNFVTHLKRSHSKAFDEYEKDKIEDTRKKKLDPSLSKRRKTKTDPKQPSITQNFSIDKKKSLTTIELETVNFIVGGMHAYSTVEEVGFINYSRALAKDPQLKLMSRRTLVRRIQNRFMDMKANITTKLENAKLLCMAADAWTCDGKSRSFLGCTAHWIDEDLKRHSKALSCRRFRGTHSFDKIAELLLNIFGEYKVPVHKIVKCVTDSGSNFLKAFREFSVGDEDEVLDQDEMDISDIDMDYIEFIDISETLNQNPEDDENEQHGFVLPPHHPCASHQLNLIPSADILKCKKASKLQHSSFAKCQGIWNKKSRSSKQAESLKDVCGISLVTPVPTRWNSFYDSLTSLLTFESKLPDICKVTGIPEFKSTEVDFLKQYIACVKPIAMGLDRLQGENNTFYGELIPTLLIIEKQLVKLKDSKPSHCEHLPPLLLECLRARFRDYLELSTKHTDAILASVCHPYFKLRWVPKEKVEYVKSLFLDKLCLELNASTVGNTQTATEYRPSCSTTNTEPSPTDDFFEFGSFEAASDGDSNEKLIKDELNAFLQSDSTEITMLHNFPHVKQSFVKYNTPLPSSAPVERLFNYAKMVLNPQRRSLTDENFEINTLLKVNRF